MCKSEIFAKILRIVSKETEVSEDLILSKCKRSDIVDSRGIMVVILSEYKFSESQISMYGEMLPSFLGTTHHLHRFGHPRVKKP